MHRTRPAAMAASSGSGPASVLIGAHRASAPAAARGRPRLRSLARSGHHTAAGSSLSVLALFLPLGPGPAPAFQRRATLLGRPRAAFLGPAVRLARLARLDRP